MFKRNVFRLVHYKSSSLIYPSLQRQPTTKMSQDNFICVNATDVSNVTTDACLEKNKKIYDIRKSGKRLWIKFDDVTVRYPYSVNQYGKADSKDGTFVVTADNGLRNVVDMIDDFVKTEFQKLYRGKVINNIMMTQGTIDSMFRSSLYNDTLRLYVNPSNCAIFKSDASIIKTPNLADILTEGLKIGIVIEPNFAWVFNNKIGIHWDARQVKLQKFKMTHGTKSLFNDGKPIERKSMSSPSTSKFKFDPPAGSFKNVFHSDDEEEDTPKKMSEKKVPNRRYTMLMDDDDE